MFHHAKLSVKTVLTPMMLIVGLLAGSPAAFAVHPQAWKFANEAAYAPGHFHGVIVNNYGDLTLSRQLQRLLPNTGFDFINAIVVSPHGKIWFGTSPHGKVYRLVHGKPVVVYTPPAQSNQVLSLALAKNGKLLVAACGGKAELVALTPGGAGGKVTAQIIFHNSAVQYIWSIVPMPDGSILLATGPHGEIWSISPAGKARIVLKTGVHNVTSLIRTAHGSVLAGTDGPGLVIRINPKTGQSYVLMSANHAEISALAMDVNGDIFAATASPHRAKLDGGVFTPVLHPNGRPVAVTIPIKAPGKKAPGKNAAEAAGKATTAPTRIPGPFPSAGGENAAAAPSVKSNVVYQVSPSGRVRVLLKVPDMVLSMLYVKHHLILGLAGHGRLLSYDPFTQTETLLERLKQSDLLCLAEGTQGRLLIGTANQGQIYQLSSHDQISGYYVSKVLDAKLPADWGAAHIDAKIPAGSAVTIQTRSGNVRDVKTLAKFWSRWSALIPANSYRNISSPAARFLQFRLILKRSARGAPPVIRAMRLSYQQINVPPVLSSVRTKYLSKPVPAIRVRWKATDPNGDTLEYTVAYQQHGIPVWIQLAKDIAVHHYVWHLAGIPDGYYRIKVIASDAPDNTPTTALRVARESRRMLVDNTPPTITGLKWRQTAGKRILVTGVVSDKLSPVVAVSIQVDSAKNWRPAAASAKIFDSPLEGFRGRTGVLTNGPHRIVVKAADAAGNKAYVSVLVNVH
ncbi:MAG: hypothetical protein ACP5VQ_06325 [Phycisphaerae bacterium]